MKPVDVTGVLDAVAGMWSLPSTFSRTKVHHGYRRVIVYDGTLRVPALAPLLDQFTPVHNAWLSWIEVGGFIVRHVDGGPYRQRWQVPITDAGLFDHDGRIARPDVGVPFRVHHYWPHAVTNPGPGPRVSLVIDRAVLVADVPDGPFRILREE